MLVDGFAAGDNGWYLDSGASGHLVYRVPGKTGSAIALNVWVDAPPGVSSTILARAAGQPAATLATDANLNGDRLVLPPTFAAAPTVDIEFQARNGGAAHVLVIDQLVTYRLQGAEPRAPPRYVYLALGGLVSLVTLAVVHRRRHALLIAAGMGTVVGIAATVRIINLFAANGALRPDAVGYKAYADQFHWWPVWTNGGLLSGTFGGREPLYPMVVHAYFQILGSSDFHVLVVSATLSIAVVVLSVLAARRRLLFWPAALAVGLLVALSGPLVAESSQGLRLELETVMLLLLYLALDRGPSRHPLLDALMIGVLAAAVALTRTYFIPLVGAVLALSFLVRYRPLPRAVGLLLLAVAIMVSAEGAHRIGLYEQHQDAFSDTGEYARWNANIERFAYQRPLPHPELFPTFAQYQASGPYTGPKISSTQYLFVIHSPQELVRDSLAGSIQILDTLLGTGASARQAARLHLLPGLLGHLANRVGERVDVVAQWLVLLGLAGLVIRARRNPALALIPIMVLSWVALTAFLFDHSLLERYRHTWQTVPLALIAGAWLVQSAVMVAMRRLSPAWKPRAWFRLAVANLDLTLVPISVVLAVAQIGGRVEFETHNLTWPSQLTLAGGVLLVLSIVVLVYRRPAPGTATMLVAFSVVGAQEGALTAAAALLAVLARGRPPIKSLLPTLAVVPFAAAVVFAGGTPGAASLLFAASMFFVVASIAVVARRPAAHKQLLWFVAAMGLLAGIAFVTEPQAPQAGALVAPGAVTAFWLYFRGNRWALPLALLDLAIVLLTQPFFAWLGLVVALAWIAVRSGRLCSARLRTAASVAALACVGLAASTASIGATTPPTVASWHTDLADTQSSLRQQLVANQPGEDSIWIFGRQASAHTDYTLRVRVVGGPVDQDVIVSLLSDQSAWVRVPLYATPRFGDRLEVSLSVAGKPNPVDRFVQIGGIYAHTPDTASAFSDGSSVQTVDLSPDAGIQAGTYLIVLGNDALPLASGGLPEPLVQGRLQPPMGEWLPGESASPARADSGTWELWGETLRLAAGNPIGLGTDRLARALNISDGGFGPGLSARSEYLQAAAEWGIGGLAGLLVMLGVAAWLARRSGGSLPIALVTLTVVSMAGESLLLDPGGAAATWLVIGLCLAISSGRHDREEARARTPEPIA